MELLQASPFFPATSNTIVLYFFFLLSNLNTLLQKLYAFPLLLILYCFDVHYFFHIVNEHYSFLPFHLL